MSDGLKLLASILTIDSPGVLARIAPESLLPGNEQTAYDFIRNHHRQYRELPQPSLLRDELSITLPRSPESIEFYLNAVYDRYTFNQVRTHYESLRASMQTADVAAISDTVRQMHA